MPIYLRQAYLMLMSFCVGLAIFALPTRPAAKQLTTSVLVIDQFEVSSAFSASLLSSFRAIIGGDATRPVNIYIENLDLARLEDGIEEALRSYLEKRYKDKPIGLIVAVGTAAFELVLRQRASLWPEVPVIFAQSTKRSS